MILSPAFYGPRSVAATVIGFCQQALVVLSTILDAGYHRGVRWRHVNLGSRILWES